MQDTNNELDPALRKNQEGPGWSIGEYTLDDVNSLYGSSAPGVNEEAVAVKDLSPRIDHARVAEGVDGDRHLDGLGQVQINETGLYRDVNEVQASANDVLGDLGMADNPESVVTVKEAANETVSEVLTDGQDEDSGRLDNEGRRSARNAAIATKFDKALRQGDTTALERLPASVATKVAGWLGDIGQRYGGAEHAPNEQLNMIGEYIAFAEKVAEDTDKETVVRTDGSGEIIVESTDDIVMRILDGDPEAVALLNKDDYDNLMELQADWLAQYGNMFAVKLEPEDQELLVKRIRKALLVANAERLALAA
ncbi:MAG TPA: hypothetical protein PKD28_02360 [Candidatus Saccharibacteria bacterium]|nr:hypothetical protein [Candidatus Saccharibacteria bacterium]